MERKINLDETFNFLWQISNNRPILLLIDEIGKAKYAALMPSLNQLRSATPQKFLPFYSALNPNYLTETLTSKPMETRVVSSNGSSRPIWFVPLFRRHIEDVEPLFRNVISKQSPDKQDRHLKRYIAFCNGHMRTLQALYNVLSSNPNANMEFHSIAQQTMFNLQRLGGEIPIVNAEDAKTAILGKEVNKNDLISSFSNTTYLDAIVRGYFFNSEDDLANQSTFVPKLTPFALYWVCAAS